MAYLIVFFKVLRTWCGAISEYVPGECIYKCCACWYLKLNLESQKRRHRGRTREEEVSFPGLGTGEPRTQMFPQGCIYNEAAACEDQEPDRRMCRRPLELGDQVTLFSGTGLT